MRYVVLKIFEVRPYGVESVIVGGFFFFFCFLIENKDKTVIFYLGDSDLHDIVWMNWNPLTVCASVWEMWLYTSNKSS